MGVWGRVCAQNFRRSSARIACLQVHIDEVEGICYKVYTVFIHAHFYCLFKPFLYVLRNIYKYRNSTRNYRLYHIQWYILLLS